MAKGSVRKKGKKWYYRYYVEDASGNLVQKECVGTESKSETEKLLRKAMEEYESKKIVAKTENITLGELLDVWVDEELKVSSLSNNTVTLYLGVVKIMKRHPLSKRKLRTVTSEHMQEYMDYLSFGGTAPDGTEAKPLSIDRIHSFSAVLQRAFRYAVFPKQYISFNPMQYVVIRRPTQEVGLFATEDEDVVISSSSVSFGNGLDVVKYGAFIEIAPGVEGLIHVSEMSWSAHLHSAQEFMKVGDEVDAVILTLDREERKMSLGVKQLKEDPWEKIEEKYPVGSKHTAKVRNFTNFGVFVEVEEGVDGLIHISDLSWTKKVKHPSEFTKIGEPIEVQVLDIDKENRRLSLGHKQLEDNPWDKFEEQFTQDSIHEGKVIEVLDKGAVIALEGGVEGFATPKHLVKEDGSQAQLGETLEFKVIEFNKDAKRIILSHSRIFEDVARAEAKAAKKAEAAAKKASRPQKEQAPVIKNVAASTSLGDIDALAALKEKMDDAKE